MSVVSSIECHWCHEHFHTTDDRIIARRLRPGGSDRIVKCPACGATSTIDYFGAVIYPLPKKLANP